MKTKLFVAVLTLCCTCINLPKGISQDWHYATTPTLTNEMLIAYEDFIAYLLDITFTTSEKQQIRQLLKGYWQSGDAEKIQLTLNILDMCEQFMAREVEEREFLRVQMLPNILLETQKVAEAGDAEAQVLFDAYYRENPPIASGRPPLTRDLVDAFLNADYFVQTQIYGKKIPAMGAKSKEVAYKAAAADYKKLSAEQQKQVVEHALKFGALQTQWKNMNREERLMAQVNFGATENLSPQDQMMIAQMQQQMNHMMRSHSIKMFTNELNFMQQSQQMIMGSAPRWNPACNCYEQIGGIVTEYR